MRRFLPAVLSATGWRSHSWLRRSPARWILLAALAAAGAARGQIAVLGETVYTMEGPPIVNGVVLVRAGKIERVGPAGSTPVPKDYRELRAKVVTPGLIDARTVVGMAGYLNQPHDQDQAERSTAVQPELRALDGYDPREKLVEHVRGFGVTTLNTGHGPGPLVSGQTMLVKTAGRTAEGSALKPEAMLAATFGEGARERGDKSPGTRAKMMALLRAELVRAQEARKKPKPEVKPGEGRDLKREVFERVVARDLPLLVTVNRAHDILTVIRLAKEFELDLVLDGAAEAHLVIPQIRASGYPVILHPTMQRAGGETENLSFETAAKLRAAGIRFALQSGFESYVPKTRVVLFEAALAAANGLKFEEALASITVDAARILGLESRVGSLAPGKDADIALYDGDPFEYTSHCTGVVIDGAVLEGEAR